MRKLNSKYANLTKEQYDALPPDERRIAENEIKAFSEARSSIGDAVYWARIAVRVDPEVQPLLDLLDRARDVAEGLIVEEYPQED